MESTALKSRTLQTANGMTTAEQVAKMTVGEFDEEVAPYIIDLTRRYYQWVQMHELGIRVRLAEGRKPYV